VRQRVYFGDKGTSRTVGSVKLSTTNHKNSPANPAIIFGDGWRPITEKFLEKLLTWRKSRGNRICERKCNFI
jgi:hypothetical protein